MLSSVARDCPRPILITRCRVGLFAASAGRLTVIARFSCHVPSNEANCRETRQDQGNEECTLFDQTHGRKYSARRALIWDGEGV